MDTTPERHVRRLAASLSREPAPNQWGFDIRRPAPNQWGGFDLRNPDVTVRVAVEDTRLMIFCLTPKGVHLWTAEFTGETPQRVIDAAFKAALGG